MEEKINKQINNLIEDNENILKQEIKFIQDEFRNKIEELKKLKEELKNVKNSFNNGLEDYLKEKNLTIEKEREIESLLSKISKMRKNMVLSLNQTLNKKFYIHLNDISNNKQKEIILIKIFNYIFNIYNYSKLYLTMQNNSIENITKLPNINNIIDDCQSVQELLKILRNENEIKNILSYSYEIFHNLQDDNNEIFINIKNSFFELLKEINSVEKQFPFDFLLDFIKNNFIIIDYEKQVEDLKIKLNTLINEKNEKFVKIKNIESILKIYRRNNKIISNYIKALKSFYYRIKEQNKINSSQNINENNNNNSNNIIIRELIDDIEKFKKITIDYDKINSNFDAMTSLSFGTNYTLSEKSSIKSSIIDSKNNNEDIDNEKKSEGKDNNNDVNNENDFNMNFEQQNNNISKIKKDNIEKNNKNENKNKLINKIQKNIKFIRNTANKNNNLINKKKGMKKNISLVNNNISNLTTELKSQTKNQINPKNLTLNKKNYNKNNISYDKELRNKNLNKQKIINNKNILPQKNNAQKILNKEIKKRFNSNIINNKNKNGKNISPNLKTALNIKNKSQIFPKNNSNKFKKINNSYSLNKIEKVQIKKKKNGMVDLRYTQNQESTIKLLEGLDRTTDKELKNKRLLSSNERYNYQNNNKYNISKKIEQLKQKENEESLEISMPNKDNNINNINDNYIDSNNIKDSICDEMVTQNFGTANNLIRSTTNDYINRLGFKNNVLWSENLYKNKAMKFKSNFKKLNIEKPIDTSSCCAACT